jgi:uncharacterized membrane protein
MNAEDLKRGAKIVAAVATMLTGSACASDGDDVAGTSTPLMCVGGNSCQGMSECAGGPGGSDCAGMNECTGMGWSYADSEEECEMAGGTVES